MAQLNTVQTPQLPWIAAVGMHGRLDENPAVSARGTIAVESIGRQLDRHTQIASRNSPQMAKIICQKHFLATHQDYAVTGIPTFTRFRMQQTLVAYLRVSTLRQGQSGLGLEAQQEATRSYAARTNQQIVAEFTEIESGAVRDRPQLAAAIELCRKRKAVLLIARLDRLSRSLSFIAQLLDANIEIRAADMPEANRMMLQMLGVFAEHERRLIGERTKAALAAAKARGVVLGVNGKRLAKLNSGAARAHAETLREVVSEARSAGALTTRDIADFLNRNAIPSREGSRWYPASASRLLRRLEPVVQPV